MTAPSARTRGMPHNSPSLRAKTGRRCRVKTFDSPRLHPSSFILSPPPFWFDASCRAHGLKCQKPRETRSFSPKRTRANRPFSAPLDPVWTQIGPNCTLFRPFRADAHFPLTSCCRATSAQFTTRTPQSGPSRRRHSPYQISKEQAAFRLQIGRRRRVCTSPKSEI
jgi:hypothetical protein